MKYMWMGVKTWLGTSKNPIVKGLLLQDSQKETMFSSPLPIISSVLRKRKLTTSVIVYEAGDCKDNSEDSKVVFLSPFLDLDSLIRDALRHSSRLIGGN